MMYMYVMTCMHVMTCTYVCDAVYVPDLLTSSNVGSTIDNQVAVNKEGLVTKGATDLITGLSHLFTTNQIA